MKMKRNKITAKFRYSYLFKEDKKFSKHLAYVHRTDFEASLRQRKLSSMPISFFPYNFWDKPSQVWKTSLEYWYNPIFPSKVGLVLLEICNIISLFRQFRQSFFIFLILFRKVPILFCIPVFSSFSRYSTLFFFLNFSQKVAKIIGLLIYFFWKKRCFDRSNALSFITHDTTFARLVETKLISQPHTCYFEQNQKASILHFEDSFAFQSKKIVSKKYFILGKHAILLFYLVIFSRWLKKKYELITFKG